MDFETSIKEWVSVDNKIKSHSIKLKELRETRNNIGDHIFSYVEQHNLSNATIQISDGKLKFTQLKSTPPLTYKFLTECLMEKLEDEKEVKEILAYIKSKREYKVSPDIRRTYTS